MQFKSYYKKKLKAQNRESFVNPFPPVKMYGKTLILIQHSKKNTFVKSGEKVNNKLKRFELNNFSFLQFFN